MSARHRGHGRRQPARAPGGGNSNDEHEGHDERPLHAFVGQPDVSDEPGEHQRTTTTPTGSLPG